MRSALAVFLTFLTLPAFAQNPSSTTFRLVTPHSTGSILIDHSHDWELKRMVVYDKGQRPVVQLSNAKLGIIASYILDDEPHYNDTTEMCRNDVLNGIMKGALSKAIVKNKQNGARTLPNGQQMLTASYFVEKMDGVESRQQTVYGFVAAHHVCAMIHLSRAPFKAGDEKLFEEALNSFTFDPDYQPTPADYAFLANMLPPDMAALYHSTAEVVSSTMPGKANSIDLALIQHPGLLHMDAPNFEPTEYSAKPNGKEFGIRAVDRQLGVMALSFLFLPEPPQPTAIACRDWMLRAEKNGAYGKPHAQKSGKSTAGVDWTGVEYEQDKKGIIVRRYFVASGDLCADMAFFSHGQTTLDVADTLIETLRFDPAHVPDFFDRFRYAQVLYDHREFAAAAPAFESALTVIDGAPDALKWRRIAADQAAMAYGSAGNLAKSRAVLQAAIARDPDYPLYYYNLACGDAESGDASSARQHLQQAFDRRANTLPGEKMPDPTTDDSILKLRQDKTFWTFVQALPRS